MEHLKAWRKAQNLTQAEAGERVGVDRISWWRWEHGHCNVHIDRLSEVSRTTGIPKADLRPDIFCD